MLSNPPYLRGRGLTIGFDVVLIALFYSSRVFMRERTGIQTAEEAKHESVNCILYVRRPKIDQANEDCTHQSVAACSRAE